MSISYFLSENIKIFPCANRSSFGSGSFDPESRVVSEHNFTRIPGILPGKDSYKISYMDGLLRCVIHGYYIEISGLSEEPTTDYLILSTVSYPTTNKGTDAARYSEMLCALETGEVQLDQESSENKYEFKALCQSTEQLTGESLLREDLQVKMLSKVKYYYLNLADPYCTVTLGGHTKINYDEKSQMLTITTLN